MSPDELPRPNPATSRRPRSPRSSRGAEPARERRTRGRARRRHVAALVPRRPPGRGAGLRGVQAARHDAPAGGPHRHRRALAKPREDGREPASAGRDPGRDGRRLRRGRGADARGAAGRLLRPHRRARRGPVRVRRHDARSRSGRAARASPRCGPSSTRSSGRRRTRSWRRRCSPSRRAACACPPAIPRWRRRSAGPTPSVPWWPGSSDPMTIERSSRGRRCRRSGPARCSRVSLLLGLVAPAARFARRAGGHDDRDRDQQGGRHDRLPRRGGAHAGAAGAGSRSRGATQRSGRGARAAAAAAPAGDAEHGGRPVRRPAAAPAPTPAPAPGPASTARRPDGATGAEAQLRDALLALAPQARDKDLFVRLGLPETAGREDVKKAFLSLARQFHPDRFASSGARRPAGRGEGLLRRGERGLRGALRRRKRAEYLAERKGADRGARRGGAGRLPEGRGLPADPRLRTGARLPRVRRARRSAARLPGRARARRSWSIPTRKDRARAQALVAEAAKDPACDRAHFVAGVLARDEGDEGDAERHFRAAVKANPRNADAVRELQAARGAPGREAALTPS